MPDSSDVVLITRIPEPKIVEGFLEFTLVSRTREHVYWASKHRARRGALAILRVLDQDMAKPDNVCPLRSGAEQSPPHG